MSVQTCIKLGSFEAAIVISSSGKQQPLYSYQRKEEAVSDDEDEAYADAFEDDIPVKFVCGTAFVEAKEEQKFAVVFKVASDGPIDTLVRLQIDGEYQDDFGFLVKQGGEHTWEGCPDSNDRLRPFIFDVFKVVKEDYVAFPARDKSDIIDVGTIRIAVHRVAAVEESKRRPFSHRAPHRKIKKTKALIHEANLSHHTVLGRAKGKFMPKHFDHDWIDPPGHPSVEFCFKYRSRALLEELVEDDLEDDSDDHSDCSLPKADSPIRRSSRIRKREGSVVVISDSSDDDAMSED